jgi:hypothetical protein
MMFLTNFCLQAQHWLVQDSNKELTMEEARHLSSKGLWASEEFLWKNDSPIQNKTLRLY